MTYRRLAFAVCFVVAATGVFAQQDAVNLNNYYAYPFSVGVGYRPLSPFGAFAASFAVNEVAASVRVPIPPAPFWHLLARVGIVQFDDQQTVTPDKWDHQHVYGAVGGGVAQRISKEFELGADLYAGLSESVFPNALDVPVGSLNLIAGTDLKLSLNPSYNVSVDLAPGLQYVRSLSPFHDYDGFSFGIGVAGHYRFGTDPDSSEGLIRSIAFDDITIPEVFAAMQSYYVNNPVGEMTFTNTDRREITDVEVSFFQNGFMDSPTPVARTEQMAPGESRTVPLLASYNEQVFSVEGVTPVTGEVIVAYRYRGKPAEQRQSVTYDLRDKTALTWDDDRKMGAFITPADGALQNYASFVRTATAAEMVDGLSESVQIAAQIYEALDVLGILYQIDPTSPFTEVQDNTMLVDSVSLPRDTLVRLTGDCDDLTALYASLLESLGLETAFITTPGHIYVAFDTGVTARDFREVHPDRSMSLVVDGDLWVPVEITLIGREPFLGAWREGISEWNKYADAVKQRGFYKTREAQEVYRPVGLRERDLGLQYGDAGRIADLFANQRDLLIDARLNELRSAATSAQTARAWNEYGIAAASLNRLSDARAAFERVARLRPESLSPLVNLGSVSYLLGDFGEALAQYESARRVLEQRNRTTDSAAMVTVLLNISRSHYAMAQYDLATSMYERAAEIAPEQVQGFAYLANAEQEGARASSARSGPQILFVPEEE